jgi:HD-GYP domain-containing protein (c-di-GMP phosphodiesterase class II)
MGINISVSFGWYTKDSEDQSMDEVLKNAENYMYQKKLNSKSSKQSNIIRSILNTLQIKCPRERDHSQRVSRICEEIGKAFNLGDNELNELKIAGELHDIGKIAIDISILNKSGGLKDSEWAQIKKHPEIGYRILNTSREFIKISEYVLAHHEKIDGSGYPQGLKGDEIIWQSKVIAVADSYDAMTCDRPHRKALSREEAAEEIIKNAGTQFDPEVARVFIEKVLGMKYDKG